MVGGAAAMEHGSTVEERIEQLELALLEQEHRLFHVLFNFFTLRPALGSPNSGLL
jgi:hypothetical protein